MVSQGSVTNTTGYVNYIYNISARGTSQVASQLLGLSGIAGNILGQIAFQTSSYLSTTEGALLSLGVVASAGLTKATEFAAEFNQEMETVHAISGKTVTSLAEDAMEMSNKFGVALSDMTKGLEALARAGVSTGNMTTILEQAMGLSKLEGIPLEKSINSLISTTNLLDINNLDLESPEYAEAVKYQTQKITATSEAAPINANDIIHTLEHIGGYASSTRLDQDDLYAVIAQLGSKGTKSEMAGTSLRAFIAAGQKDTAQRALKRIGLDVKDLWKDDETIMSISDMKDVLDEAMEARGYTQQEKLEFYSDFAGYKQANQIMKIDTTSVREFKDKIDRSWDTSKKMQTVLDTAQTNLQSLMQTGINFLTKVGEPLLPIVSTVAKVLKTIIDVVDAVPFSNWIVAGGLMLVSVKSISTIFNKVGPQLLSHVNTVLSIRDLWADTKDSIKESYDIISNWRNISVLQDKEKDIEFNRITDEDRLRFYQKKGHNVKNYDDVRKLEWQIKPAKDTDILRSKREDAKQLAKLDNEGKSNRDKNQSKSDAVSKSNDFKTMSENISKIYNLLNGTQKASSDTELKMELPELSDIKTGVDRIVHILEQTIFKRQYGKEQRISHERKIDFQNSKEGLLRIAGNIQEQEKANSVPISVKDARKYNVTKQGDRERAIKELKIELETDTDVIGKGIEKRVNDLLGAALTQVFNKGGTIRMTDSDVAQGDINKLLSKSSTHRFIENALPIIIHHENKSVNEVIREKTSKIKQPNYKYGVGDRRRESDISRIEGFRKTGSIAGQYNEYDYASGKHTYVKPNVPDISSEQKDIKEFESKVLAGFDDWVHDDETFVEYEKRRAKALEKGIEEAEKYLVKGSLAYNKFQKKKKDYFKAKETLKKKMPENYDHIAGQVETMKTVTGVKAPKVTSVKKRQREFYEKELQDFKETYGFEGLPLDEIEFRINDDKKRASSKIAEKDVKKFREATRMLRKETYESYEPLKMYEGFSGTQAKAIFKKIQSLGIDVTQYTDKNNFYHEKGEMKPIFARFVSNEEHFSNVKKEMEEMERLHNKRREVLTNQLNDPTLNEEQRNQAQIAYKRGMKAIESQRKEIEKKYNNARKMYEKDPTGKYKTQSLPSTQVVAIVDEILQGVLKDESIHQDLRDEIRYYIVGDEPSDVKTHTFKDFRKEDVKRRNPRLNETYSTTVEGMGTRTNYETNDLAFTGLERDTIKMGLASEGFSTEKLQALMVFNGLDPSVIKNNRDKEKAIEMLGDRIGSTYAEGIGDMWDILFEATFSKIYLAGVLTPEQEKKFEKEFGLKGENKWVKMANFIKAGSNLGNAEQYMIDLFGLTDVASSVHYVKGDNGGRWAYKYNSQSKLDPHASVSFMQAIEEMDFFEKTMIPIAKILVSQMQGIDEVSSKFQVNQPNWMKRNYYNNENFDENSIDDTIKRGRIALQKKKHTFDHDKSSTVYYPGANKDEDPYKDENSVLATANIEDLQNMNKLKGGTSYQPNIRGDKQRFHQLWMKATINGEEQILPFYSRVKSSQNSFVDDFVTEKTLTEAGEKELEERTKDLNKMFDKRRKLYRDTFNQELERVVDDVLREPNAERNKKMPKTYDREKLRQNPELRKRAQNMAEHVIWDKYDQAYFEIKDQILEEGNQENNWVMEYITGVKQNDQKIYPNHWVPGKDLSYANDNLRDQNNIVAAALAKNYGMTDHDIFGGKLTTAQQERVDQLFANQEFVGFEEYREKNGLEALQTFIGHAMLERVTENGKTYNPNIHDKLDIDEYDPNAMIILNDGSILDLSNYRIDKKELGRHVQLQDAIELLGIQNMGLGDASIRDAVNLHGKEYMFPINDNVTPILPFTGVLSKESELDSLMEEKEKIEKNIKKVSSYINSRKKQMEILGKQYQTILDDDLSRSEKGEKLRNIIAKQKELKSEIDTATVTRGELLEQKSYINQDIDNVNTNPKINLIPSLFEELMQLPQDQWKAAVFAIYEADKSFYEQFIEYVHIERKKYEDIQSEIESKNDTDFSMNAVYLAHKGAEVSTKDFFVHSGDAVQQAVDDSENAYGASMIETAKALGYDFAEDTRDLVNDELEFLSELTESTFKRWDPQKNQYDYNNSVFDFGSGVREAREYTYHDWKNGVIEDRIDQLQALQIMMDTFDEVEDSIYANQDTYENDVNQSAYRSTLSNNISGESKKRILDKRDEYYRNEAFRREVAIDYLQDLERDAVEQTYMQDVLAKKMPQHIYDELLKERVENISEKDIERLVKNPTNDEYFARELQDRAKRKATQEIEALSHAGDYLSGVPKKQKLQQENKTLKDMPSFEEAMRYREAGEQIKKLSLVDNLLDDDDFLRLQGAKQANIDKRRESQRKAFDNTGFMQDLINMPRFNFMNEYGVDINTIEEMAKQEYKNLGLYAWESDEDRWNKAYMNVYDSFESNAIRMIEQGIQQISSVRPDLMSNIDIEGYWLPIFREKTLPVWQSLFNIPEPLNDAEKQALVSTVRPDMQLGYKNKIPIPEEEKKEYERKHQRSLFEQSGGDMESYDQAIGYYNYLDTNISKGLNWMVGLTDRGNKKVVNQTKKFSSAIENVTNDLTSWQDVLQGVGNVFPPLKIAAMGLESVLVGFQQIQTMNDKFGNFMKIREQMKDGGIFTFLGQEFSKDNNLGKLFMIGSGLLSKVILALEQFVLAFAGPIAVITGALLVFSKALDWSKRSYDKWLKQLEEDNKEQRSKSIAMQTNVKNARNQLMSNRDPRREDFLNRNYQLARARLANVNAQRSRNAIDLSNARNDMLWGNYGFFAGLDKLQGKYQSTAKDYEGSSEQIRRIKEGDLGNIFSSEAMKVASAYYDANRLAISQIDEYKDELGKLYDTETGIMRRVGPDGNARKTPEFQKALDNFVEATGITRDHAQQYLDYMQTEHNVDKATQAMQAQADKISAMTEMKIQAISFGGNPSDVLGLNGIEAQQNAMVKAQADMIKLELSGQLFWRATWATITAPLKLVISPIFAMAHILAAIWAFITGNWTTAWDQAGQAVGSFDVTSQAMTYWGAWAETETTDFNSIGQSNIDNQDRMNYGNAATSAASGSRPHMPGPSRSDRQSLIQHNERTSVLGNLFGGVTDLLNKIITILTTALVGYGIYKGLGKILGRKEELGALFGHINEVFPITDKLLNLKDIIKYGGLTESIKQGFSTLFNYKNMEDIIFNVGGKGKGLFGGIKEKISGLAIIPLLKDVLYGADNQPYADLNTRTLSNINRDELKEASKYSRVGSTIVGSKMLKMNKNRDPAHEYFPASWYETPKGIRNNMLDFLDAGQVVYDNSLNALGAAFDDLDLIAINPFLHTQMSDNKDEYQQALKSTALHEYGHIFLGHRRRSKENNHPLFQLQKEYEANLFASKVMAGQGLDVDKKMQEEMQIQRRQLQYAGLLKNIKFDRIDMAVAEMLSLSDEFDAQLNNAYAMSLSPEFEDVYADFRNPQTGAYDTFAQRQRETGGRYSGARRAAIRRAKGYSEVGDKTKYLGDMEGHAHHLNGYNWYEEGRADPNNLIYLDEATHNAFHEKYGKGGNTIDQFLEFLTEYSPEDVPYFIDTFIAPKQKIRKDTMDAIRKMAKEKPNELPDFIKQLKYLGTFDGALTGAPTKTLPAGFEENFAMTHYGISPFGYNMPHEYVGREDEWENLNFSIEDGRYGLGAYIQHQDNDFLALHKQFYGQYSDEEWKDLPDEEKERIGEEFEKAMFEGEEFISISDPRILPYLYRYEQGKKESRDEYFNMKQLEIPRHDTDSTKKGNIITNDEIKRAIKEYNEKRGYKPGDGKYIPYSGNRSELKQNYKKMQRREYDSQLPSDADFIQYANEQQQAYFPDLQNSELGVFTANPNKKRDTILDSMIHDFPYGSKQNSRFSKWRYNLSKNIKKNIFGLRTAQQKQYDFTKETYEKRNEGKSFDDLTPYEKHDFFKGQYEHRGNRSFANTIDAMEDDEGVRNSVFDLARERMTKTYVTPWKDYMSDYVKSNIGMSYARKDYRKLSDDEQQKFRASKEKYLTEEERNFLAQRYGIDLSSKTTTLGQNKLLINTLQKNDKWEGAVEDLYAKENAKIDPNMGLKDSLRGYVKESYVTPWKEYVKEQYANKKKETEEKAKAYVQGKWNDYVSQKRDEIDMLDSPFGKGMENASLSTKIMSKMFDLQDSLPKDKSLQEVLQDPEQVMNLAKDFLGKQDKDSWLGQQRDKIYNAQEILKDPEKTMGWIRNNYSGQLDKGMTLNDLLQNPEEMMKVIKSLPEDTGIKKKIEMMQGEEGGIDLNVGDKIKGLRAKLAGAIDIDEEEVDKEIDDAKKDGKGKGLGLKDTAQSLRQKLAGIIQDEEEETEVSDDEKPWEKLYTVNDKQRKEMLEDLALNGSQAVQAQLNTLGETDEPENVRNFKRFRNRRWKEDRKEYNRIHKKDNIYDLMRNPNLYQEGDEPLSQREKQLQFLSKHGSQAVQAQLEIMDHDYKNPRERLQEQLDKEHAALKEDIAKQKEELDLPKKPQNALAKKGKAMREQADQRKGLAGLGMMMDDVENTAEKTRTRALKICPECGFENDADSTHCIKCGARLDGKGRIHGALSDRMSMLPHQFKTKGGQAKDKISDKIPGLKEKMGDKVVDPLKAKAGEVKDEADERTLGVRGRVLEAVGNSKIGGKLFGDDTGEGMLSGLNISNFNPNIDSQGKLSLKNILSNEKVGNVLGRVSEGEDVGDIAKDALLGEGEGVTGLMGEKGGFAKGGKIMENLGSKLAGQEGTLGKIGEMAGKGGKGLGKLGKGGMKGLGKLGGKALTKIGSKVGSKALSQVGSKLLGGALLATGIGAPLGLLLESPIGGFLMEGAMNIGGKVLGGIGGAVGGIGKAIFGGGGSHMPGGGGLLGGLLKATPLGMLGGLVGGAAGLGKAAGGILGGIGGAITGGLGAMFGGILGLGGGAKGGAGLMKAAGPFAMVSILRGMKDVAEKHFDIGKKQKDSLDKIATNTNNATNNNKGGSITIQNININTDDDPEAIKAMFLDLIVELQEQVNPRLVSRTTGSSNTSTSDSSEQTDTESSQQQQSNDGSNTSGQN